MLRSPARGGPTEFRIWWFREVACNWGAGDLFRVLTAAALSAIGERPVAPGLTGWKPVPRAYSTESALRASSISRSIWNGLNSTLCSPSWLARTIEWCGS